MTPKPNQAPVEQHTLSLESYAALEKQVSNGIAVTNDTSPLQAGYQLGVQAVLSKLRKGWVIGA